MKYLSALCLLALVTMGCVGPRLDESFLSDDYLRPASDTEPAQAFPSPVVRGSGLSQAPEKLRKPVPPFVEVIEDQPEYPRAVESTPVPILPGRRLDADTILAAQAVLDAKNFSPGCLDGRFGSQTRQALRAWRESEGRTWDGHPDDLLLKELAGSFMPTRSYTLTAQDVGGLTPVPPTWPERAKMSRMDHETVLERIAERHHSTEGLIRSLNPNVDWVNPAVGLQITVPRIPRARSVRVARIEVLQTERVVRGFDANGKLIALFPCSIATDVAKRPSGRTTVKNLAADPNYTFDPEVFPELSAEKKGSKRLLIPPGPNNPVGAAWVGLNLSGYGIHGTPKPERIGSAESHGCIRLSNWNALKLAHMVRAGVPVQFRD